MALDLRPYAAFRIR